MSVAGGVECVLVLGCMRWAWKRCTYVGSDDSASWPLATPEEFEPIPRICNVILSIYETDMKNPQFSSPLDPDCVIKRVTYEQTLGRAPPYLVYIDHQHKEIVLAIRGLNLIRESDYKVLLDNKLGRQMFDGGFVHHGLLKSAAWLLDQEEQTLKELWESNGREYTLVFAGHSLGSGVASLMSILLINHRKEFGGIPREKIKCYAVAPARCMSLNLAVKYADVINSVILQDDFLPRTATPLEDIFSSIFCLPCLLFLICLRDTFIPEGRKLRDPRRLYAPGRMYHIVDRKFCRCGRFPPVVRTAIPVDGRFEHIVLSSSATSDHAIVWIKRETEKALQVMKEKDSETMTAPPKVQKFERLQTLEKEHHDALERAVSLNIPHAVSTLDAKPLEDEDAESSHAQGEGSTTARSKWNKLIKELLDESKYMTTPPETQRVERIPGADKVARAETACVHNSRAESQESKEVVASSQSEDLDKEHKAASGETVDAQNSFPESQDSKEAIVSSQSEGLDKEHRAASAETVDVRNSQVESQESKEPVLSSQREGESTNASGTKLQASCEEEVEVNKKNGSGEQANIPQ